MYYIGTIILSIIGYFLGSISFAILVVKGKAHQDIRNIGSKNAGATNASRVLGKKWGLVIMFLDAMKVVVTVLIAFAFSFIPSDAFNQTSYFIPCLFTLIGHCFPIYYKFKGGKAVSCVIGLLLVTNWILFIVFAIVWFSLIFIFKRVSVSSVSAAVVVLILIWIPQISLLGTSNWTTSSYFSYNGFDFLQANELGNWKIAGPFNALHQYANQKFYDNLFTIQVVMTLSVIILVLKHKQNIIRIFKGTEPAFLTSKKAKTTKTTDTETK